MGLRNQLLLDIYKDKASVFTMQGIAMAYGQGLDRVTVKNRMINYVRSGEILNPRKGIYAKPGYDEKELACLLYTPSYLSLEYVLQRAGVVFQYSDAVTSVGNLSRTLEIDGKVYRYRKIKGEILVDTSGIIREGTDAGSQAGEYPGAHRLDRRRAGGPGLPHEGPDADRYRDG